MQEEIFDLAERAADNGDPHLAIILIAASRLMDFQNLKEAAAGMLFNFAMAEEHELMARDAEMNLS